jgi:hypothetical protein
MLPAPAPAREHRRDKGPVDGISRYRKLGRRPPLAPLPPRDSRPRSSSRAPARNTSSSARQTITSMRFAGSSAQTGNAGVTERRRQHARSRMTVAPSRTGSTFLARGAGASLGVGRGFGDGQVGVEGLRAIILQIDAPGRGCSYYRWAAGLAAPRIEVAARKKERCGSSTVLIDT